MCSDTQCPTGRANLVNNASLLLKVTFRDRLVNLKTMCMEFFKYSKSNKSLGDFDRGKDHVVKFKASESKVLTGNINISTMKHKGK